MRVVRMESIADALDRADPRVVLLQPIIVEISKGERGGHRRSETSIQAEWQAAITAGSTICVCGRSKKRMARVCVDCLRVVFTEDTA